MKVNVNIQLAQMLFLLKRAMQLNDNFFLICCYGNYMAEIKHLEFTSICTNHIYNATIALPINECLSIPTDLFSLRQGRLEL